MNDSKFGAAPPGSSTFRAVFAMTLTQLLVVAGLFSVLVAAPVIAAELGVDPSRVGLFTSIIFLVSIWTTVIGGNAAARVGGVRVSQVCLIAAAAALGLVLVGEVWALLLAAIVFAISVGPETPASSHLLSRIVPQRLRPRLFSVRQTGNQFGAIAVSLFVPAMTAVAGWRVSLAIVAATCLAYAVVLEFDRRALRAWDVDDTAARRRHIVELLRMVWREPALRRLAAAAVAFCATQICLNGFFVTYLVEDLAMSLVRAGIVMAVAQAGGLLGRVGWGLVVERIGRVPYVLGALGLAMAACAALAASFTPAWPFPLLLAVSFVFGLTASGWNGVFLAEAARLSPAGMVGEITGALSVLIFVALVLGPLTFAMIVASGLGYGGGYLVLSAIALAGAAAILRGAAAAP